MLAWRDLKHPQKGGAEVVTDIYLKGLKQLGHEATLFTSRYPGSEEKDNINGYNVIRKGNKLSVSLHGLIYAKKHEKEFDIIIEQINTLPFLTPLLISKDKRVLFSHQLCKNVWFYEMPFPLSYIGYAIESLYLKFYKNTRAFTVSNSSKQDLIKYAKISQNNILVLDNQIDFKPIKENQIKQKENYIIFCGRLNKSKRPDEVIKALSIFLSNVNNKGEQSSSSNKSASNLKLIVIGTGSEKYKQYLLNLTKKLNIGNRVHFTGSISNQERNKIMQKALAIIVTSIREGWGLIVTEANANGTLAITYDIEGLRDANNNSIGFITKENTPEAIAECMGTITSNPKIRKDKELKALKFANAHSNWNKQVRRLEEWLRQ